MRKFNTLKEQLSLSEEPNMRNNQVRQKIRAKIYRHFLQDVYIGARKNGKELKLAFSEYYLSLIIIQDYQKFNLTGFRKINKKFDKNFLCDLGKEWFDSKVKESELNEGKDIENLITKVLLM